MPTAEQLTNAVKGRIPGGMPVEVGKAPRPNLDPKGRALGYVTIWPGVGRFPEEEASRLDGAVSRDQLRWVVTVTPAAGDPVWALRAAEAVEAALLGWRPLAGVGRLRHPQGEDDLVVMRDEDGAPDRWFVPLRYWCMT